MARTFDIIADTDTFSGYAFSGNQRAIAERINAERVLFWPRDGHLPQYVLRAIAYAGYNAVKIGRTTFKSTTWGLVRK